MYAARLAALVLLAGCTPAVPSPEVAGNEPGTADDRRARATAAGLSDEQAHSLATLGVPVVVPVLPEGWALADFEAAVEEYDGMSFPFYQLAYRRTDGSCFALEAASGGLGGVFADEPPHLDEVEVPGIATYGPAFLGWGEEGEGENWSGRMQTEWFGADGIAFGLSSAAADGCRPLPPEEAATLLETVHYLDPVDDALALGTLAYVDLNDPPVGELALGPTPEGAAAQVFAPTETEGHAATTIETLRQRPEHAVVLVTNTNLPDDSIQDERVRVVLRPGDEGWLVTEAGRQVRCREGRGHADWSPEPCL